MMSLSLILCAILYTAQYTNGFVPEIGFEDAVACRYQPHLTRGRVTCCGNSTYPVGINYIDFWAECATPATGAETLDNTMWRMYSCLVEKGLSGSPLDLKSFAELMTKNYDDARKARILEKISKTTVTLDGASSTVDKMKIIQHAYYDVETIDCFSPKEVAMPLTTECNAIIEEKHRRGSCCLNNTIPMSVIFPYTKESDVLTAWKDLLETVSFNDPLVHGVTIQKTCEITSDLLALGKITKDEIFQTPDPMKILDIVTPSFLTAEEKKNVKDSAIEIMKKSQKNATDSIVAAYVLNAERVYERSLKSELVDIKDEVMAKSLFVTCLTHSRLSRYIQAQTNKKCWSQPQ